MEKLDGKVALVTGSGRGIGRSIALKLASEGARLVVNDLDAETAEQTLAAIAKFGGEAIAVSGSVTEAVSQTAMSARRWSDGVICTSSSTMPATPGTASFR